MTPLERRRIIEAALLPVVSTHGLEAVCHALVEYCYAHAETAIYPEPWTQTAHWLTYAERAARGLGVQS